MGTAGECCSTERVQPDCLGTKLLTGKELQKSLAFRRFLVTAVVTQTQPFPYKKQSCLLLSLLLPTLPTHVLWTYRSSPAAGQGTDPTDTKLSNSSVSLVIQLQKRLCQYKRNTEVQTALGQWDCSLLVVGPAWCYQSTTLRCSFPRGSSQPICCCQNRHSLCPQFLCVFSPLPASAVLWGSKWAFLSDWKPQQNLFWLGSALIWLTTKS